MTGVELTLDPRCVAEPETGVDTSSVRQAASAIGAIVAIKWAGRPVAAIGARRTRVVGVIGAKKSLLHFACIQFVDVVPSATGARARIVRWQSKTSRSLTFEDVGGLTVCFQAVVTPTDNATCTDRTRTEVGCAVGPVAAIGPWGRGQGRMLAIVTAFLGAGRAAAASARDDGAKQLRIGRGAVKRGPMPVGAGGHARLRGVGFVTGVARVAARAENTRGFGAHGILAVEAVACAGALAFKNLVAPLIGGAAASARLRFETKLNGVGAAVETRPRGDEGIGDEGIGRRRESVEHQPKNLSGSEGHQVTRPAVAVGDGIVTPGEGNGVIEARFDNHRLHRLFGVGGRIEMGDKGDRGATPHGLYHYVGQVEVTRIVAVGLLLMDGHVQFGCDRGGEGKLHLDFFEDGAALEAINVATVYIGAGITVKKSTEVGAIGIQRLGGVALVYGRGFVTGAGIDLCDRGCERGGEK